MYLLLTLGAALAFALGGVRMENSAGMTRLGPTLLLHLLFTAGAAHTHGGARRFDALTPTEALRWSQSGAKALQDKAAAPEARPFRLLNAPSLSVC